MTVFKRIEDLRKLRHISQGKLEKELGFSNGSISKWKTSMPTPERLQKLADYFDVSVDYLLGKAPFKNESEAHLSINIAAVKYLLNNKDEIPHTFDTYSVISTLIDDDSNSEILTYSKSLLNKFDKNLPLTDLELYELSHILFKEIKGQDYTGIITLKNFYGDSFTISLDLDAIEKIDPNRLDLDNSFLFKSKDFSNNLFFRYESALDTIYNKTIKQPTTIAAHLPEGVELTEEEQEQLDEYIQFLLSRRKK